MEVTGKLSPVCDAWLKDVLLINTGTAEVWYSNLVDLEKFLKEKHGMDATKAVKLLVDNRELDGMDIYALMSEFVRYLTVTKFEKGIIGARVLKHRVNQVRNFLEAHDVAINHVKFRLKIRLHRPVKREKNPAEKQVIRQFLQNSSDIFLTTLCVFEGATGWRPKELLWMTHNDIERAKSPPVISLPGELAKTKGDRHVYLSKEAIAFYEILVKHKYRSRMTTRYDPKLGKRVAVKVNPVFNGNDLIFAPYHDKPITPSRKYIRQLYQSYVNAFTRLRKKMGIPYDTRRKRYKITFYSFREFVFSTIDGLGFHEYAEYYIGHSGSTYWTKPEKEKIAIYKKVEPYLTFLDFDALEARTADIESQLEEKDQIMSKIHQKHQEDISKLEASIAKRVDNRVKEEVAAFFRDNPEALKAMREKVKRDKKF